MDDDNEIKTDSEVKSNGNVNGTRSAKFIDIKYEYPRYILENGDGKGIQGNLNSCYMDTSLLAIFTFNGFLDNMLMNTSDDSNIEELRGILRDKIVFPLRKDGYVDCKAISKFRDKLQSLSTGGKFVMNERDPEELLELLFKLLCPLKYLLRTTQVNNWDNVQKCVLTQIFCESIPNQKHMDLLKMLTLSFLEYDVFITMPPKCLMLQLPRDGKELKIFEKVSIPNKLDITPFILTCPKRCKACTSNGSFFCKVCSRNSVELTYYCKDHKMNCNHEKTQMPHTETVHNGKVELELVSVLCIQRNHYVSFVKTNYLRGRWIYFNSMEKIDNGIFTPVVRDTNLYEYFAKDYDAGNKSSFDDDIERIENSAFICIYKNPALEFYDEDFNCDTIAKHLNGNL